MAAKNGKDYKLNEQVKANQFGAHSARALEGYLALLTGNLPGVAAVGVNQLFNNQDSKLSRLNKYANQLIDATASKGRELTFDEVKTIMGKDFDESWSSTWGGDTSYQYYQKLINENYDDVQAMYDAYSNERASSQMQGLMNSLGIDLSKNSNGLTADTQAYLDALNLASQAQYDASMNELELAENNMYRSIGMSQRQMERDIAKRRQQALKSGMSTAQLAAQEQQNLLAAQQGAQQIAQNYADKRYGTITQFAGTNATNMANALQMQMQNNQTVQGNLMNAYAQLYAADRYKNQ